jgi:hypothetical protein
MMFYARGDGADFCELSVFHDDLGSLALARAEDDGRSRPAGPGGCATAMGVVLKTEFAPAQLRPEKKNRGHGDHAQSCNLLPIHNLKIAVCCVRATGCFGLALISDAPLVRSPSVVTVILLANSMIHLLKSIEYRSTERSQCDTKFNTLSQICR